MIAGVAVGDRRNAPPPEFEVLLKRLFVAVGALAIAFIVAGDGGAQTAQPSTPTGSAFPAQAPRSTLATFVQEAVTDVKLCNFALGRTLNVEVRSYCRTVVSDEGRIALEAAQLSRRYDNAEVALDPEPQTSAAIERLSQESQREFDRNFLILMIAYDGSNNHAIRYAAEFSSEIGIRRYADAVLRLVQRHLDTAESILRRLSEVAP